MARRLAGAMLCSGLALSSATLPATAAASAPASIDAVNVDGAQRIRWDEAAAVARVRYAEIDTAPDGTVAAGDPSALSLFVVGGEKITIAEHRYAAKVFVMDGPFSVAECVGVIVDPEWVLTAAHCTEVERTAGSFVPATELAVVAGTADWTAFVDDEDAHLRFTSDVVVHPGWDRSVLHNDLALVRVEPAFSPAVVDTIPLYDLGRPDGGDPAYVLGWGATETGGVPVEALSGVPVAIDPGCGVWPVAYAGWDNDSRLCASGPDAGFCQGDSGGPLVIDRHGVALLAGLVSFNSTLGCGVEPAYPDVYSRISYFADWIESVTGPLWLEGVVDGSTALLPDARPGRAYAVQLFDDAETVMFDGRVEMPGATILGPRDTGVDCAVDQPHPFVDVAAGSYASGSIGCLWRLGVTRGTAADTFSPGGSVTREQIAAFAARFYETVSGTTCHGAHPFEDVAVGSYANAAIGCVASLGVTTGTSPTTYSPHDEVTREQMAAYIARLYRSMSGQPCGDVVAFVDVRPGSYAERDIGCLSMLGITKGVTPTRFDPGSVLTREQLAAFFARLYVVLTR